MRPNWKAALAIFLLVAAAPFRAGAQESSLVRLSFSSGWDALPAVVGIERGFFAQQGLIVSGLAVSSAGAVINSLAAGSTDFALVPQRVLLVMAAANAPVKVVAMGGWGTQTELVAKTDSGIKSVADLKGKKVAVLRGSDAFPVLIRLLNTAKLQPADVTILQVPVGALLKALEKGEADAVFESREFTAAIEAQSKDQVKPVLGSDEVSKAIGYVGALPLVATNKEIEKEPHIVQKVVTAWAEALKYITSDPEDAGRVLQIFFHRQGVTVPLQTAVAWVKMRNYNQLVWTAAATADAEYNGWGLNTGNILKVAPKLTNHIDSSFAEKVASQAGVAASPPAAGQAPAPAAPAPEPSAKAPEKAPEKPAESAPEKPPAP
jgi:sulfonate transport system substrate-binding protein